ncbi:hypothetical protein CYLTODRAFT_489107 [Cylindrobasidium torrendii FP15055 ss-10]|uniref:Uncharacterized protein n=1 Tax=Cylindrobasidium torrendii FP15055 ss-10 TaxID=1314674 RepID=A0A0D7BG99_9AGAR|nr:hypothetical protein CYLTODRAFT_489107 [Cylindrobasidium torrendii FP15055 ss-10]
MVQNDVPHPSSGRHSEPPQRLTTSRRTKRMRVISAPELVNERNPPVQESPATGPNSSVSGFAVLVLAAVIAGVVFPFTTSNLIPSVFNGKKAPILEKSCFQAELQMAAFEAEKAKIIEWVETQKHWLDERERAVRYAERRDRERRMKAMVYWSIPKKDEACMAWKWRGVTAELMNVPEDVAMDGREWCKETPFKLGDGRENSTNCEYVGCERDSENNVIGHWTCTDEIYCNTWWKDYTNDGCQKGRPGHRLITMQLADLHPLYHSAAYEMCRTTPWPGHGTPDACEWTMFAGMWGKWFVEDESCRVLDLVKVK